MLDTQIDMSETLKNYICEKGGILSVGNFLVLAG